MQGRNDNGEATVDNYDDMDPYGDYDECDDIRGTKYDGRYHLVAGMYDRAILTITYLEMLAEKQDGYFSDDAIVDAAALFTLDEVDEEGCWVKPIPLDRDFLIEAVYDWLRESEEAC